LAIVKDFNIILYIYYCYWYVDLYT